MSEHALSLIDDYRHRQLLSELNNNPQIKAFLTKLDQDNQLVGAGVIYIDSKGTMVKVRDFQPICRIKPIHVVLNEVPPGESPQNKAVRLRDNERESRLIGEGVGTLLSCGAAVLGWVVVVGSAGAAPISGGTSTAITVLAYGAATASTLQCINGAVRTSAEVFNPELNDLLDSQEWYSNTVVALDIISVAGAGAAGLSAIKAFKLAQSASGRPTAELLKTMTRHERKRITQDIIRLENPGISNTMLKKLVRAGLAPARYTNSQINTALVLKVKDAIGATMSFSGSAMAGVVNGLVVGVYEEIN